MLGRLGGNPDIGTQPIAYGVAEPSVETVTYFDGRGRAEIPVANGFFAVALPTSAVISHIAVTFSDGSVEMLN